MPGKKHKLASKKQERWAFAAEKRGELAKGTARRWAHAAKGRKLPESSSNPVESPVTFGNPTLEHMLSKGLTKSGEPGTIRKGTFPGTGSYDLMFPSRKMPK